MGEIEILVPLTSTCSCGDQCLHFNTSCVHPFCDSGICIALLVAPRELDMASIVSINRLSLITVDDCAQVECQYQPRCLYEGELYVRL